jgi:hypothetical protein
MDPRRACTLDRAACSRPQLRVFGDQRSVEVAGECCDLVRELGREFQPDADGFVRNWTSALTSLDERWANDGMTPLGYPGWM